MEKNILGNKISLVWTMRKLNTPLSVSSYPEGTKMGQKVFGYPAPKSATWYDHGDIYFDREEIELIKEFLRYKIQIEPTYPDKIAKHIFSLSQKIKRQHIRTAQIKNKSLHQLVILFKKEQRFFLEMIGFMSYRGSVQMSDVLREKIETIFNYRLAQIGKLIKFNSYIETISLPLYESVIAEEKKYALQQAIGFKSLSENRQTLRIKAHLRRHEWLAYHWFVGTPPTQKEIRNRLLKLAPTAVQELRKLKRGRQKNESNIQDIIKELKLGRQEQLILRQYRTWLFLRTFVKDNINEAGYKLLPVLYVIAEHREIEPKLIPFLTFNEIRGIEKLSKREIDRRINQRRHGFSAGIIGNKFAFRKFDKSAIQEGATELEQLIKGSIAHKGKIKGIARVLFSPKEQNRLKRGEILVTSMTTPDLLPAMERAAAFVTDEGGITCHAAIIAREMKKPCIIGTKIATKVLKDGDLVEVDANEGVVRKLE